jgi:hypothetical protein
MRLASCALPVALALAGERLLRAANDPRLRTLARRDAEKIVVEHAATSSHDATRFLHLSAWPRSSYKSMIFSTIATPKLRGSKLKSRTFVHSLRLDRLMAMSSLRKPPT